MNKYFTKIRSRQTHVIMGRFRYLSKRLHGDETGSISLASVFALILLAYLLGLVMNSARQADQRVKLQNTADAAARSGGVMVARTMNTVAFTNHLISDVFALTAFFREAKEQQTAGHIEEIFDHWRRVAPHLESSEFPKFAQLGADIQRKLPVEEQMVLQYLLWAQAASEQMLPVLETILKEELISQFQRDLLSYTPLAVQAATNEVAQRHSLSWPAPVELSAVMWRTIGDPLGGASEEMLRSIPIEDVLLDPYANTSDAIAEAKDRRDVLAKNYLNQWNNESLRAFDQYGKMSQFANLWRGYTCGQLERLLNEEYPELNLPMRIRPDYGFFPSLSELERDYNFVAVVYAKPISDRVPRLFRNPLAADQIAVSQVQVFIPRQRVRTGNVVHFFTENIESSDENHLGGMPRDFVNDPAPGPANRSARSDKRVYWRDRHHYLDWLLGSRRENAGTQRHVWSVMNQNWEMQLVPATASMMPQILSQPPGLPGTDQVMPPNFNSLSSAEMQLLIQH
jgi:hypothetical protein